MHTGRCGNNCRQKCHRRGGKKETKIQGFILVIIGASGVVTKGLENS
jgi:hypothetical protein